MSTTPFTDEERYYDIDEVKRILGGVSTSTMRRIIRDYREYLHLKKGTKKHYFSIHSLKVCETIISLRKMGLPPDEIIKNIKDHPDVAKGLMKAVEVGPPKPNHNATQKVMEYIQRLLRENANLRKNMEKKSNWVTQELQRRDTEIEDFKTHSLKHQAFMVARVHELEEEIKKLKEEQEKSWISKLFKKLLG